MIEARYASLIAFAQSRAFCPTGEGGGIDNSCGSSSVSHAISVIKESGDVKEIEKAISSVIGTKKNWFGENEKAVASPSELCKQIGLKQLNLEEIDLIHEKGTQSERRGVAVAIAKIVAAAKIDPSIKKLSLSIDTAESLAAKTGESPSEYYGTSGLYQPDQNSISLLTPNPSFLSSSTMHEAGYWSTPDESHEMIHEMSHKYHYDKLESLYGNRPSTKDTKASYQWAWDVQVKVLDNIAKEIHKDPDWKSRILEKMPSVSEYANTDPFEGVAEYSTAVRLGYSKNDKDLDRFCKAMGAPVPKRMKK